MSLYAAGRAERNEALGHEEVGRDVGGGIGVEHRRLVPKAAFVSFVGTVAHRSRPWASVAVLPIGLSCGAVEPDVLRRHEGKKPVGSKKTNKGMHDRMHTYMQE